MYRPSIRFALPTALVLLIFSTAAFAKQPPAPPANVKAEQFAPLALKPAPGQALPIRSEEIKWRGNSYYLLTITKASFSLDPASGHLKGELNGGILTFDDVTFGVHVAVFDAGGKLLGTASTTCKVPRLWIGYQAMMNSKLGLDLGTSLDYKNARTFMVAISKQKTLTPDDWQK